MVEHREVRRAALRPGYLFLLFVVLALVLSAFALYGLRQSRQVMLEIMERGALTLAEAVARAEENAEVLLEERLFASARLLRDLDALATVSDTLLQRLVVENDLAQLDIIDGQGVLLASSAGMSALELAAWRGELKALATEGELLFVGAERIYTAAVVRPGGGMVLARASGEYLVLGGVGAGAATVRQNYALLGEAYVRVQTSSSRILAQMADAVIATDLAQGRIQVFNGQRRSVAGAWPIRGRTTGRPRA